MKRPGAKPAASSFIHFYPARLPRRAALIHKVVFGNVDLQFAGQGESFGELEGRFRAHLEPGMSVEPAGKSVVVRIRVPEIDMLAPFEVSAAAVGEGLKAAARLIAWHRASVEGTGSD